MSAINLDQALRHLATCQDTFEYNTAGDSPKLEMRLERFVVRTFYLPLTQDNIDSIAAMIGEGWDVVPNPIRMMGSGSFDKRTNRVQCYSWTAYEKRKILNYDEEVDFSTKLDASINCLIAIIIAEHGEPQ